MIKIILKTADNGIIKKIVDDNHNGGGETLKSTIVYDLGKDNDSLDKVIEFLYDISEDTGLYLGNKYEKETVKIIKEWGSHYEPTDSEIKKIISEYEERIKELQLLLDEK